MEPTIGQNTREDSEDSSIVGVGFQRKAKEPIEWIELSGYLESVMGISCLDTWRVEDGMIKYDCGNGNENTIPVPEGMAGVKISNEINLAYLCDNPGFEQYAIGGSITILVPEDVAPELNALQAQFEQIRAKAKDILGAAEEQTPI